MPRLEIGTITQVTQPVYKYQAAVPYNQMQEQVVDVYANVVGAQRQFQQLPANKESADFGTGNVFVTINREAMNAEIGSLKNEAVGIINRYDEEKQKRMMDMLTGAYNNLSASKVSTETPSDNG